MNAERKPIPDWVSAVAVGGVLPVILVVALLASEATVLWQTLVALLGSYLPARGATRIDPTAVSVEERKIGDSPLSEAWCERCWPSPFRGAGLGMGLLRALGLRGFLSAQPY